MLMTTNMVIMVLVGVCVKKTSLCNLGISPPPSLLKIVNNSNLLKNM